MKFVIYLKKKNLFNKLNFLLLCFLLLYLLLFQKQNLYISKEVLLLWFNTLIPSLFPFLLFTEILNGSNLSYYFGKLFSFVPRKIFNLPTESAICIITGFLCGYPNGAKNVVKLYSENIINENTANKLLSFINNCNPIYIFSSIGIAIFADMYAGCLLYLSHILSSIIIGITYPSHNIIPKNLPKVKINRVKSEESFTNVLRNAILNSFKTLIYIFGFMIIFSILSNIANNVLMLLNVNSKFRVIICSLFEMTSGVHNLYKVIDNYTLKMCLISFLISFSSLSVIFQIYSVCSNYSELTLANILKSKIWHGILSCAITYILIYFFPIFQM